MEKMEIDQVTSDLRGFIRERFGIPENDSDFNDEVDLFNYGYIDSFGAVELTSFIENRFSIRLTESDWVAFPLSTINEISSFVSKRHKGEL
jgi:acyl carrier protein